MWYSYNLIDRKITREIYLVTKHFLHLNRSSLAADLCCLMMDCLRLVNGPLGTVLLKLLALQDLVMNETVFF